MKDLDTDKCINQKALIPIVRSVVFVEGGLNTKCTGLLKFVWLVLIFKYETNLWRKYKRNKI